MGNSRLHQKKLAVSKQWKPEKKVPQKPAQSASIIESLAESMDSEEPAPPLFQRVAM